ncbi:MAG: nicotinamide riboside transporter PnuC [Ferruginibacter sp.]
MTAEEIIQQFIAGMKNTGVLEYIAVFTGIASVWYSRKENILVYPTGLISTIIYIYLSFNVGLYGEGSVNFYYTVMSIYGWILWTRKDTQQHLLLKIASSSKKEWIYQLAFCSFFYVVIFVILHWLKKNNYSTETIPWADAFASSTAFTGMWLMAKKKIESWYWWIATNIASIPLYFVKHYVFSSVYYIVLLIMAVFGLLEWIKRRNNNSLVVNNLPADFVQPR